MTTNGTQDPRWAQAEAMLHEGQDSSALPAGWGRRNGGYLVLAGLVVVLVFLCAGSIVQAHNGSQTWHPTAHATPIPVWRGTVAGVLITIGAVLGALGVVLMTRTGLFGRRWISALSVLGSQQKLQLMHEMSGQAPLQPAHLPLARHLALRMTHLRGLVLVVVGVAVMELGGVSTSFDPLGLVVVALLGLAVVGNLLTTYQNSRLGQRFLDRHPAEGNN